MYTAPNLSIVIGKKCVGEHLIYQKVNIILILLTFTGNKILRLLKLKVKVNFLHILYLLRIWMRGLKAKGMSWALN